MCLRVHVAFITEMKIEETITAHGIGHWYVPQQFEWVTAKRCFRYRNMDQTRVGVEYVLRFKQPVAEGWDKRVFQTADARQAFFEKAFTDVELTRVETPIVQPCPHVIEALTGDRLVAVHFVLDYLQLQFDDNGFTATLWPTAWRAGARVRSGEPGYRDAFCWFIGRRVTRVEEYVDVGVVVEFGDEDWIELATSDPSGEQIEVLEYNGPNRTGAAWPWIRRFWTIT
jgi:hypothetical protein